MTSWNESVANSFESVSTNIIRVGTSGTQLPDINAGNHILKNFQSGIVYLAGVSSVNSGVGYILAGGPSDAGASLKLGTGNLNKLYGISAISAMLVHISYS